MTATIHHLTPDESGVAITPEGGLAVARLDPPPAVCGRCGGTGRVAVQDDEGVTRLGRCRCRRTPDRVALWNAARIPARYAGCTLAGLRLAPAEQARLAEYARGTFERGVVFWGPPGTGKSYRAVALARAWVFGLGWRVRFVETSHLVGDLRAIQRGEAARSPELAEIERAKVVVLDDVGRPDQTEWERSLADELITRIYNAGSVLLATSNLAPEALARAVSGRAASRLHELCLSWPVLGADQRVASTRAAGAAR